MQRQAVRALRSMLFITRTWLAQEAPWRGSRPDRKPIQQQRQAPIGNREIHEYKQLIY